jgi:hypothetical protein
MPFTLAHPAAAVPLARSSTERFALSALVVGSMAPDFEYPLRWRAEGHLGHTFPGLIVFCLPLGLVALALFHGLVKRPVVLLLPRALRARLSGLPAPGERLTWSRLLSIGRFLRSPSR